MVEEHLNQAESIHEQLDSFEVWSLRQAADLRAKAELADELDLDPGEVEALPADGDELRSAAENIESVFRRIRG